MASTTETGFKTTLAQKLSSSGSDTTIKLAGLPLTITAGVMKVGTGTNAEWIYFGGTTPANNEITSCIRGLKKNATSTSDNLAANKKNLPIGTVVRLVHHSVDLNKAAYLDNNNTYTGTNTYSGAATFNLSIKCPVYATTAARDAAIPSPANGMECYVTADGTFYDYKAGSWQARTVGGSASNASTTVAGVVEAATQSESDTGGSAGGTGALLSATPAVLAATIQKGAWIYAADAGGTDSYAISLTPAPAAYSVGMIVTFKANTANTTAATLNVNGLGAITIKKPTVAGYSDLDTNDIISGQYVTVQYTAGGIFALLSTPANVTTRFFGGTGADGALSVAAGTMNINLDQIYNYTSITIAGGATLSTGGSGGCMYLKTTGGITNAGTINLAGKGEAGGASPTTSSGSSNPQAGLAGTNIQQIPFPQASIFNYVSASVGTAYILRTGGRGGTALTGVADAGAQGGGGGASLINHGGIPTAPGITGGDNGAWETRHPLETGFSAFAVGSFAPLAATGIGTPTMAWLNNGFIPFCTGAGGGSGANASDAVGATGCIGGAGGAGGGGLSIECRGDFNGTGGTINLSGSNGSNGVRGSGADEEAAGGGGGGASGMGVVQYGSLTAQGTLTVTGGSGGSAVNGAAGAEGTAGGVGGAGAVTFIQNTRNF